MSSIVVRDIPNKGRGYIAQRVIKAGEVILEEQPIKSGKFIGVNPPLSAYEELATILSTNKELSDVLQYDKSEGVDTRSKALAQVKLNSFISRDPNSEDGDVYMLQLDPKASHLRVSDGGITMTIALSTINAGEEEICYKTQAMFLPTPRRRQLLQENWGFNCTCSRCETASTNDSLLMQGNMTANEAIKMSQDYDNLLASKDQINDYPDAEKWVAKAKEFLFLDLHKAHWRKINIRKWLIHFLLNPYFPQKAVAKYVREQIDVYNLLAPALHNCKLELFLTYRDITGSGWEEQLQKLDSNAKTILLWFGSEK